VQALEQFLSTTSKRDEHLVKLLTVMAKLLATSQTPKQDMNLLVETLEKVAERPAAAMDLSEVVEALREIAEKEAPAAPGAAPVERAGEVLGALQELLERTEQRLSAIEGESASLKHLATDFSATASTFKEILTKQNDTNELLVNLAQDQARRLVEVQAKQIPALAEGERRGDLEFVPYSEKEIAFMKESEVFGALSDDTLRVIRANAALETYVPGHMIFTIGDPVAEVYIIKSGIVEICRPTDDPDKLTVVAYLTSGDSIGEMSILISGDSRSSIARVPEGAEVLVVTHEVFMKLFKGLPELALRLATVFARRLKTSIKKERIQTRHRELQGSLRYFDLATVIQTLLSSDERTGVLAVHDEQQDTIAELFFETGSLRYGKLGHLLGEEAFYQLFQSDLSGGGFSFKEGKFPEQFDERCAVSTPGMSLLFEAARLSDELKVLKESIPDPSREFKTKRDALEWESEENRTLANGIWNMVKRGATASEILDSLPRSHYSIYSVLSQLVKTDQIE
jgi:CRP-like cAMP-binding protein